MSFLIPADRGGTKKEKVQLTPEVKKIIKESKRQHRAPTIKDVRKNRQKIDVQAEIKIKKIKDLMEKYSVNYVRNIGLIAEFCVEDGIFDNFDIAKMFITSFKDRIFNS